MLKINPTSQSTYTEYGGFTYQQDGRTYYTRPTTDGENYSWAVLGRGITPDVPGAPQYTLSANQIVSGWYHTHPRDRNIIGPDPLAEQFSGWESESTSITGFVGDMHTSDVTGITAYMIDPNNNMWKYVPAPNGHLQYVLGNLPFVLPSQIQGIVSSLQITQSNCGH
jgi:hypothetical protein